MFFGYNGRDGVITDENSLLYMRARYYSTDMKRFVNADVVGDAVGAALKEVKKIKEPLKEPLRAVSQGLWGIIKPVLGLE